MFSLVAIFIAMVLLDACAKHNNKLSSVASYGLTSSRGRSRLWYPKQTIEHESNHDNQANKARWSSKHSRFSLSTEELRALEKSLVGLRALKSISPTRLATNPTSSPQTALEQSLFLQQAALRPHKTVPTLNASHEDEYEPLADRTTESHLTSEVLLIGDPQVSKRIGTEHGQRQVAYILSPVSGRLLDISDFEWPNIVENPSQARTGLGGFSSFDSLLAIQNEPYKVQANQPAGKVYSAIVDECHTIRTSTQLTKDELDPATNLPLRSCKGLVQVNRCEGSCGSSVQPAIKSASGFKKFCFCCNEGSFRKVLVRLPECYSALDNRRISADIDFARSFMDIEVEEPIECKCRTCDGTF